MPAKRQRYDNELNLNFNKNPRVPSHIKIKEMAEISGGAKLIGSIIIKIIKSIRKNKGKLSNNGVVVDVHFPENLPSIFNALK